MTISSRVLEILRTWGRLQAGALLKQLNVSRPSLMRTVAELNAQIVSLGKARRTSYAVRRAVRGSVKALTVYRIDAAGLAHEVATLDPVYPAGCAVRYTEACVWPLDDEMQDGWYRGLPYWLADMRPQGFLGRNFAHQYAQLLQLDADVKRWSEDDILHTLALLCWDQPGNYVLGDAALRQFLDAQKSAPLYLSDQDIAGQYPLLAQQALNYGVAGSSAAGEFPKFTAARLLDQEARHVIVKFSGSGQSAQEQRWADLLVCEHLALETIAEQLSVAVAKSRLYQFAGRTFYEVERFDRAGDFGRTEVCSWYELNAALFGLSGSWSAGAEALLEAGYIKPDTQHQIQLLEHFGRLIANTDMHDGNLAFLPGLRLAPAYDMLPMLYAPQPGVELTARQFSPHLALPKEREAWLPAAHAAQVFWERAASDARISAAFRQICAQNAALIAAARSSVG